MSDKNNRDGWSEYQKLVLSTLEDHKDLINKVNDRISDEIKGVDAKVNEIRTQDIPSIHVEIAMLKVKSGIWGLVGGLLMFLVTLGLNFLRKN